MASVEQRKGWLDRMMRTNYDAATQRANALLAVVLSADGQAARIELMAYVVAKLDPRMTFSDKPIDGECGVAMGEDRWSELRGQLDARTNQISTGIFDGNVSIEVASERIIQLLDTLANQDERDVAFAVLLRKLAPYQPLSEELYGDPLQRVDSEARMRRIFGSVHDLQQVMTRDLKRHGMNPGMIATAVQRILARHPDPRDQQTLLTVALHAARQMQLPDGMRVAAIGVGSDQLRELLGGRDIDSEIRKAVGELGELSELFVLLKQFFGGEHPPNRAEVEALIASGRVDERGSKLLRDYIDKPCNDPGCYFHHPETATKDRGDDPLSVN